MTDLDIHLPAIQIGDADAFGLWAQGTELRIRRSLTRFAARVDVEAVVQETLLRVWQAAPRLVPDGRAEVLARFAIRVARNIAVSELRRTGREVVMATDEPSVQPVLVDPRLRSTISECAEKLPAKPKAALFERMQQPGVHDSVLAVSVGMEKNTFLQNITRARKWIIACLKRAGVELAEVQA